MAKKNLLMEASGSVREARRLVMQHLQENTGPITGANADEVYELLGMTRKMEDFQASLEVKARMNGG